MLLTIYGTEWPILCYVEQIYNKIMQHKSQK